MPKKKISNKSAFDFTNSVYQATVRIPLGKVTTYKQIAEAIGRPKSARAVGNALNRNPFAPKVPCHRVVRSDGVVGGFASGSEKKIQLLRKEGVIVEDSKIVDFKNVIIGFR